MKAVSVIRDLVTIIFLERITIIPRLSIILTRNPIQSNRYIIILVQTSFHIANCSSRVWLFCSDFNC